MSSWKECKLGDIAEIKGGKRLPKGELLVTEKTPHPYIRITDFNGHKINLSAIQYVTEEVQKSISRYIVNKQDIIISNVGTIGLCAKIPDELDNANLTENCIKLVFDKNKIDTNFLYYHLISPDTQDLINGFDVGSTQPKLPIYNIEKIDISLPPLEEQKAIAEILSSLDDKIDLLHRQNQTLESLAQTLFRQWFIEEAKEEWEVGILDDYIDIVDNRGKTPPFLDNETEYPIIEVNALSGQSRLINYSVIKKYVTEETYNSWFRAGHPRLYDTLLSTVGSIGEIAMFLLEKGSIAQNVVALRAKNISPFYLYENIKFMQNELKELDIGSVQPSIKVTHLVKVDFVKPDDEILKKFDEQMMSISNKVIINSQQIKTLENLRDTLLPKLLSGEVRVKI